MVQPFDTREIHALLKKVRNTLNNRRNQTGIVCQIELSSEEHGTYAPRRFCFSQDNKY
jgi:hypothetical protein